MSTNMFNPSDKRFYPARWKTCRGKQLFQVIDERSLDGNEELLSVSHITGITPRKQKNVTMFQSESLVGYKICRIGDIAANTMWTWQGAIGVSSYFGVISPAYNVYRQIENVYNSRYLDLLLRERKLIDVYHSLSTGIRPSRLRLYPEVFLTIDFPVPPREEQDQIVRFLDWKISEINRLIAIIKSSIRCLHQAKSKLINNCITSVTSRIKLKHIARCNCATLGESTEPEYSFRYIDIGSVDYTKGITKYETFTFKNAPSRARRIVKKHDIIISTVRTYLKAITTIYDDADVIVSTGFAVVQPDPNLVDSRFLEYCCKSDWFCDEVIRHSNGVAYPAITSDALMNLQIPFCSYDEQKAIVSHLDVECSKLDCIISNKEKTISKLQELKNRLISDVVTGKIDVRGIEIPEYEYTAEVADTDSEAEAEEFDEQEEV